MKVTLNSLSRLAWLLSFRRHACSGGAPPSKSNCSQGIPTDARPRQTPHQTTRGNKTKREANKNNSPRSKLARDEPGLTSCSAVRATYSSAGHEFLRQWKMWPLTISPPLLLLQMPPTDPHLLLPPPPARCCPRQPPIGRALQTNPEDPRAPSRAAPPAGDPPTGSATAPHRPAPPRIDSSGPRPRPPRGIGWPALLAAAGSDGRLAPAGLERPNPTGLLLFRVTSPSPRPRWCGAVWSRSRRAEKVRGRKTTEHLHRRRRRPALLEEEE